MNLIKKIAFYGLITLSFNSLSCKKESPIEAVNEKDYLKPLLGTWHMIEQNNSEVEYLVKKIFKDDKSYTFSVEDTVNRDFRAFRALIDEIADANYKAHITDQFGSYNNIVGREEEWKYFISGNRLYENDGTLYNTYVKE